MDDDSTSPQVMTARERQRANQVILDRLFDGSDARAWAVLDGARVERLVREMDSHGVESACLFAGALDPSMARVAPYLVELEERSSFVGWLLERGWGRSWGIFLRFAGDMATLRKHLRRFLMVKNPDGKSVYFRYYDPRVLRLYLPTCNAEEIASVFGPVRAFAMESEGGQELLVFTPDAVPPRLETVALRTAAR